MRLPPRGPLFHVEHYGLDVRGGGDEDIEASI